jgi:glucose-1-phosphate thymidylyltransferase
LKALILSGGRGTRLRPITFTRAKQLLPIANRPILHYALTSVRDAGITDVGVVVGDTADEVRAALGDGSEWDLRVTYIPQEAPLGLAHAVKISQPYLGQEPFVMYLGDNLVKDGITTFVDEFRAEDSDAQILLAHVPNAREFGVAELDADGSVKRLVEKPANPVSDLALVGVYLFGPRIFEAVNAISPSARGELEITDAIQWLVDHGASVRPHVIEGWWKDTGRLEDMLEANRIMLDLLGEANNAGIVDDATRIHGRVQVGAGTTLTNSVVRGPVVIGENCRISNSYIGPYTSVHDNCMVRSSEIEHSILMPGCSLDDVGKLITDSLLAATPSCGAHAGCRRLTASCSATTRKSRSPRGIR